MLVLVVNKLLVLLLPLMLVVLDLILQGMLLRELLVDRHGMYQRNSSLCYWVCL